MTHAVQPLYDVSKAVYPRSLHPQTDMEAMRMIGNQSEAALAERSVAYIRMLYTTHTHTRTAVTMTEFANQFEIPVGLGISIYGADTASKYLVWPGPTRKTFYAVNHSHLGHIYLLRM